KALDDADAGVRAACSDTARALGAPPAAVIARLDALAHDRDETARAHAIGALATLAPSRVAHAFDDPARVVRAAYAAGLSRDAQHLSALIEDRDAGVRAAAWSKLATAADDDHLRMLAAQAVLDPAAEVRLAALPRLADDRALARLAAADESSEVRVTAI